MNVEIYLTNVCVTISVLTDIIPYLPHFQFAHQSCGKRYNYTIHTYTVYLKVTIICGYKF